MSVCLNCGAEFSRRQHGNDKLKFCSLRCSTQFHGSKRRNTTPAQFWAKIAIGAPSECWEWIGTKDTHGYGQIRWHGKMCLSHRLALAFTDGDWESRLLVRHVCDNPPCCNPAHLCRGTYRDNTRDAIERGLFRTMPKGGDHPSAKLTDRQAMAIKRSSETTAEAAAKYGVCFSTIQQIRNGTTWRHLP